MPIVFFKKDMLVLRVRIVSLKVFPMIGIILPTTNFAVLADKLSAEADKKFCADIEKSKITIIKLTIVTNVFFIIPDT